MMIIRRNKCLIITVRDEIVKRTQLSNLGVFLRDTIYDEPWNKKSILFTRRLSKSLNVSVFCTFTVSTLNLCPVGSGF